MQNIYFGLLTEMTLEKQKIKLLDDEQLLPIK